jgi:hypothetical protein
MATATERPRPAVKRMSPDDDLHAALDDARMRVAAAARRMVEKAATA